ncbi:MAG TPA: hypothetical protein DCP41_06375 [Deltaproteobacteria bacterium]|nr:hypothetical protein [Deltaproteobacteria bacterium]
MTKSEGDVRNRVLERRRGRSKKSKQGGHTNENRNPHRSIDRRTAGQWDDGNLAGGERNQHRPGRHLRRRPGTGVRLGLSDPGSDGDRRPPRSVGRCVREQRNRFGRPRVRLRRIRRRELPCRPGHGVVTNHPAPAAGASTVHALPERAPAAGPFPPTGGRSDKGCPAKYTPDGKVEAEGKSGMADMCIGCHGKAKGNDFLFTGALK